MQQLLESARAELTAGRFEQAATRFQAVLARRPDTPEALFGAGVAYSQLGRLSEAEKVLRRYVELQPGAAEGHSVLGMVLLSAGKTADAKATLERAFRLAPRDLEIAKALAHIANGESDGARAVAVLKPFETAPEFDDEARLLLATGHAQSGNPKAALSLLDPIVTRQPPPPPEVFALAAGAAARTGDIELTDRICASGMRAHLNSDEVEQRCVGSVSAGFVKSLEARVRNSPNVAELIVLGRLLTDVAETAESPLREQALAHLEKAATLAPADTSALYNLGRCLRALARPGEAVAKLEQALLAKPEPELRMLVLSQLALAELQLEHKENAGRAFREALEINRRLPSRRAAAAFHYYPFLASEGSLREAEALLAEILRWDPGFLPARMERAKALVDAGRLQDAIREAEIVARNGDPANRQLLRRAHLLLMNAYAKLGRKAEAARHEEWLRKARAPGR